MGAALSPVASDHGRRVEICGLPVDSITTEGVVRRVIERCAAAGDLPLLSIFSCNVDMVVKASRDPAFARTLGTAGLLTADGMPIVWLGRALGGSFPERVTGADLLPAIAAACARTGHRVFLLGAADGVAAEAAELLCARYPGLQIAGTLAPERGFERDPSRLEEVLAEVRRARTDVLFVALGAPRQERFVEAHAHATGARVALAVGAAFDMAAGRVVRAPRLFQRMGAEWLWRLLLEPRRLGRRYLIEDAPFVLLALRELRRNGRRVGA